MTSQGPGILNGHLPEAQFLKLELKFEALDTWPKDTRIVFYFQCGAPQLRRFLLLHGILLHQRAATWPAASEPGQGSCRPRNPRNVPLFTVEVSAITTERTN